MPGWYKRIDRNYRQVERRAQLNDEVTIDSSRDSVGIMHQAARKQILKGNSDKIGKEITGLQCMLIAGNIPLALPSQGEADGDAASASAATADQGLVS